MFVVVVVRFKAVGNAPIMKQNFYKITASNRFQAVIQFLRKELGWKQGDPLVSCYACLAHRIATLVVRNSPDIIGRYSSPISTSHFPQPPMTLLLICSR